MAELVDSGKRREFGTGAIREAAEGKGRCDLLPLDILSETLDGDGVLGFINEYVRDGYLNSVYVSIKRFIKIAYDGDAFTAFLEAAKQYEDGARKYAERNWEQGIPLHVYIDSAVRHYLKYCRGDKDEPHDRAFLWNLLCAIWTHENKPDMIDLPFKQNE